MNTLESLSNWKSIEKKRVKRDTLAYEQCADVAIEELSRLVTLHRNVFDFRDRFYRDIIDSILRRYHGYAVQGSIKSHYYETDISLKPSDCIFEHVVPAGEVRDMLIEGRLTVVQALNVPTCRISRANNKRLSDRGLVDTTPNPYFFFHRYVQGTVNDNTLPVIKTHDGLTINLNTWSLTDHYNYFGIK